MTSADTVVEDSDTQLGGLAFFESLFIKLGSELK